MLVISTQHTKHKIINFLVFQEIHFEFKFINNIYNFFAHYVDIWFISISNNKKVIYYKIIFDESDH